MIAKETINYATKLKKSSAFSVFLMLSTALPVEYYLSQFDIITAIGGSFLYYIIIASTVICYHNVSNILENLSNMKYKNEEVLTNIWNQTADIFSYNIIVFALCVATLCIANMSTTFNIIFMCLVIAYTCNTYFAIELHIRLYFEWMSASIGKSRG